MWKTLGIARSLLMYYGKPLGMARMARFYRRFVQPGDICFDVGAHVGNRIRALTRIGARVVAIEPQPALAALLRQWYGTRSDVTVIECALGAQAGTAEMLISNRTPTVTTLSRQWADRIGNTPSFAAVHWDETRTVEVTTLDALIEQYGLPRFCKIDVEGYELDVLHGLSKLVRSLSFEYIPAAMDMSIACVKHLAALGSYQYNWSVGESLRFASDEWLDDSSLIDSLHAMPTSARSGDVYARVSGVNHQ